MKTAVRYYSKSGNTKKIADAIAKALNVTAQPLSKPLEAGTDVLFVGGSVNAGGLNAELAAFLDTLEQGRLRHIVAFGTAAGKKKVGDLAANQLAKKGITVEAEGFHCKGKFLMVNSGRPNADDCAEAASFAQKMMKSFK